MSDEARPPRRRIHTDETPSPGLSRSSLRYWREQKTETIAEPLRPGNRESSQVKPDGRVLNGNVRVKVLEERGFNVDGLEGELV